MCLAAFLIGQSVRFPFVLASNRDEFFSRASQPLQWWQPAGSTQPILSGRDLAGGGTWLGLNTAGRLELVTNVREPGRVLVGTPSRGELVLQCLADSRTESQADSQAEQANDQAADQAANLSDWARVPRNGFNLLHIDLGLDPAPLQGKPIAEWISNRPALARQSIGAGTFGLSNASLNTPWPKVRRLKQRLVHSVVRCDNVQALMDDAFAALADPLPAADNELPRTGLTTERERQLSSAFIHIAGDDNGAYGTRCSTVVVVEVMAGRRTVHVAERTHSAKGAEKLAETGAKLGLPSERFMLPLRC